MTGSSQRCGVRYWRLIAAFGIAIPAVGHGQPGGAARQAQQPGAVNTPIVTHALSTDSIAQARSRRAESLYVALLERTNGELSLRWTPINALVGALGVLVATLAVVGVGLQLWQSAAFRRRRAKLLQEFERRMRALEEREAANHLRQREKWEATLDAFVQESSARMSARVEEAAATGHATFDGLRQEMREALQQEVAELANAVRHGLDPSAPFTRPRMPPEARGQAFLRMLRAGYAPPPNVQKVEFIVPWWPGALTIDWEAINWDDAGPVMMRHPVRGTSVTQTKNGEIVITVWADGPGNIVGPIKQVLHDLLGKDFPISTRGAQVPAE